MLRAIERRSVYPIILVSNPEIGMSTRTRRPNNRTSSPIWTPTLLENEIAAILVALESTRFTDGPEAEEIRTELCSRFFTKLSHMNADRTNLLINKGAIVNRWPEIEPA